MVTKRKFIFQLRSSLHFVDVEECSTFNIPSTKLPQSTFAIFLSYSHLQTYLLLYNLKFTVIFSLTPDV